MKYRVIKRTEADGQTWYYPQYKRCLLDRWKMFVCFGNITTIHNKKYTKDMKYRKKPVTIDAIQWTGDNYAEIFEFTEGRAYPSEPHSDTLIVSTLEGEVKAAKGCYIIRGIDGENYPCQETVFKKTYEQV